MKALPQKIQITAHSDSSASMKASEARRCFSDVINRVAYGGERIILERRGKSVAAFVSVDDLDLLEQFEDELDLRAARVALKEANKKGTKSIEEVMEELETET